MAAWGIMPVCMALVVASIGIFANAFSFFLGQAVGPMVYGVALPAMGVTISFAIGAAILAATGFAASRLLR